MKKVATDGGARPNPGFGGWAWVAEDGTSQGGSLTMATNQETELLALKYALMAHAGQDIEIIYDSKYAVNCVTEWGPSWLLKVDVGLMTYEELCSTKKHVPLIAEIIGLIESHGAKIKWTHVRGHQGHSLNEAADDLATKMVLAHEDAVNPVSTRVFA